jgi:hypothetical protein
MNFVENADMEISPESTPSEPSYASPTANNSNLNCNSNHDDIATSPNGHHAKSSSSYLSQQNHHHHQLGNSTSGNVSNNRLHPNSKSSSTIAVSSPSTHPSHYTSSHRNRSMTPETNNDANSHHNSLSLRNSPSNNNNSNSLPNHSVSRSDSSNQLIGDGPPTPEMDLNNTSDHNNRRRKFI